MQRRLAIAFVLTALVSVLLAGFGVLAIAQAGARNRAEAQVTRGLSAVGTLLGTEGRQVAQLEALINSNRRNLQLDQLAPVLVNDDGGVEAARRGRGAGPTVTPFTDQTLSPDELQRLDDGEIVLAYQSGTVIGLRLISADIGLDNQSRLALVARQQVTAIPSQTVTWFLVSSVIVIIGALAAAMLLARRLVRPIQEIQGATAAIAAGHLATRVGAEGDDEMAELGR
ncbi:MAG: HAMP domain-containing protein, partial [Actinomycetota bacterium]